MNKLFILILDLIDMINDPIEKWKKLKKYLHSKDWVAKDLTRKKKFKEAYILKDILEKVKS